MKKKEAFLENANKAASDPALSMKWLKFYSYPRFVLALIFWIVNIIAWIPMYLLCTTGMESRRVVIAKFLLSVICFILEIVAVKAIRKFKGSAGALNRLLLIVESLSGIFIFGVDNLAFDKNSHEQSILRLAVFAVLSLLWLILNSLYFSKRKKIFTGMAPAASGTENAGSAAAPTQSAPAAPAAEPVQPSEDKTAVPPAADKPVETDAAADTDKPV